MGQAASPGSGSGVIRPGYLTSRQAQARDLLLDDAAEGLRFTDTIERLACAAHAVENEVAEAEDPAEESLLDLYSLDLVQEDLQVPPAD